MDWAKVATRAACGMGVPGGFCGIRRRGPRRYSDPTVRRPPTSLDRHKFIQPSSTRCDGHHRMIDSGPVVQKKPRRAGLRLGRRTVALHMLICGAKWMSDFDVDQTLNWRSGRWAIALDDFSHLVSKRLGSPCRSGRSQHWVKMENPAAPPSHGRPRRIGAKGDDRRFCL